MSEPSDKSTIPTRSKAIRFIFDNSLLLLAGTAAGVVWANLAVASYDGVAHPLHFWVNDVGMVFFFALAAKEVFEATLPGGSLASPRRALSPLAAAVGGMVAPALIYVALASTRGPDELIRGVGSCSWSTVCARRFSRTLAVSWAVHSSATISAPCACRRRGTMAIAGA
jgi:Na+/H+ antiporter NhaA